MKKKKVRMRNFVQAHVQQFCKPQIFESKRDKEKQGYRKHKVNFAYSEQSFGVLSF